LFLKWRHKITCLSTWAEDWERNTNNDTSRGIWGS
jgi:hypothetical protein